MASSLALIRMATLPTLYSFDENNFDGFGPIGAMVQGTNGAFYGITSSGGANGDGTIFEFTPGGAPGFLVWFDKALGEQQSGQNGNNGVMTTTSRPSAGLTKGAGRLLWHDSRAGAKTATAPCSVSVSMPIVPRPSSLRRPARPMRWAPP